VAEARACLHPHKATIFSPGQHLSNSNMSRAIKLANGTSVTYKRPRVSGVYRAQIGPEDDSAADAAAAAASAAASAAAARSDGGGGGGGRKRLRNDGGAVAQPPVDTKTVPTAQQAPQQPPQQLPGGGAQHAAEAALDATGPAACGAQQAWLHQTQSGRASQQQQTSQPAALQCPQQSTPVAGHCAQYCIFWDADNVTITYAASGGASVRSLALSLVHSIIWTRNSASANVVVT
jgi:hypothetical protein